MSSRPICNADTNELPGMASRHSGPDLSVRAALLHVDSLKIPPEQHICLLGRERSRPPVQAAPANVRRRCPPVPYLNYPQRVPQMTRGRRMSYVLRWLHLPCTQGMSLAPGMYW